MEGNFENQNSNPYVDLEGSITLVAAGGRESAIYQEYRGHANIKGRERQDSFIVFLSETKLDPGHSCKAKLKFKFSNDERFKLKFEGNEVLELNEGATKIGEFKVEKVINKNLQ